MKQRAIVLATACAVGLGLIVVSIPLLIHSPCRRPRCQPRNLPL